jgi:branched-chain amino acid transport system permease protein
MGMGLAAIRDNDNAASSSGINIFALKLFAFVISAFITSIAGAVFFMFQGYISPESGFSMRWTMTMILATVIGGISTEGGPIMGTVIIVFLHFLLARYAGISLIIQGVLLIIIMLLAPQGIMGFIRSTRTYNSLLRLAAVRAG